MGVWGFIKERAGFVTIGVLLAFGFVFMLGHQKSQTTQVAGSATSTKPPATVQDTRMSRGDAGAKLTIVQYSDFLCPSCSYVSTHIMPEIIRKYVDTGKANLEFRPMAFIAPGSQIADEGAYCSIDQGKFWQYHDAMYSYVWDNAFSKGVDPTRNTILTSQVVKQVARDAQLNGTVFDSCLDRGNYTEKVKTTTAMAQAQGVTGTPYILVNGEAIKGQVTAAAVESLIKVHL